MLMAIINPQTLQVILQKEDFNDDFDAKVKEWKTTILSQHSSKSRYI